MLTRRACLRHALALPIVPTLARAAGEDLTRYVNVAIGTGGHGHTFPGACVPFGAVQFSPDTGNHGWDWCSGYHASDRSLVGFSHTHLSGTGIGDLLDVLVVPRTGPIRLQAGSKEQRANTYRSRFSHADEEARPGYYSVLLRDTGIRAELTATDRTGLGRFTFPQSDSAHFLVDLAHGYAGDPSGICRVAGAELRVVDETTIVGSRRVEEWAKGRQIFFAMKFSRPFRRAILYAEDQATGAQSSQGKHLKAVLEYPTQSAEAILTKTGISGVSIDGALRNLSSEMHGFDFDAVRARAAARWQRELSKIRIETENESWKRIFYSSLYHTMVAPTLFDDVDGQYRGMDGRIHRLDGGAHNYSTFSLWDTYRALHPLYTLTQSERVPDLVNCLIRMAEESPQGAPVWPLQGVETGCMSGYHSAPVIAEALKKQFAGIDAKRAYAAMRPRAMTDDYRGLGLYRKTGFIPADLVDEAASRTLEYAYDDWAVASIAESAGQVNEAKMLRERSRNYRNLFDKNTKFMRPRLANGQWAEPFDPRALGHGSKWHDFTECNSWQATFLVQHTVPEYIRDFGDAENFVRKLDELFDQSSTLPPDSPPDIAGLVGQYAHGNEPSHHIAYLYSYAGAAHKTQLRVRTLLERWYRDDADGIAGNEDCGQMSAWYVLSALGFYPVDPVSGNYVFGSPLFTQAAVELGEGRQLALEARRQKSSDQFIQRVEFNGEPYTRSWFSRKDIQRGGSFVFVMGSEPNPQFGSDPGSRPA